MKRYFVFLLLILPCWILFSQGKAVFTPEKPKIGDVLKISYDPKGSKLEEIKAVNANLLLVKELDPPVWKEVRLTQKGKTWNADYRITDTDTRLILVKFSFGKVSDDNNENVWDILIYGKDKKPMQTALDSRGVVYSQGDFYDFKKKKDLDKAISDFEGELKLYPDSWRSKTKLWRILMRRNPDENLMKNIRENIVQLYEKNSSNDEALLSILPWFEAINQKSKGDSLKNLAIAGNPKGAVAKNSAFRNAYNEKDPAKRTAGLKDLLANYKLDVMEKVNILMSIISYHSRQKEWIEVENILNQHDMKDGRLFIVASYQMVNDEKMAAKGIELATKGIELLSKPEEYLKPSYMTKDQWKEECGYYGNDGKNVIATGLITMAKYEEAEKILEELYRKESENRDSYGKNLANSYLKSGKNDKAFKILSEMISKEGASDDMTELFKNAYIKIKGSDTGFAEALDGLKNSAKKEMREKLLKELVNKPAPDFALKSLDGKTVTLSGLKGKIIVVDFWATWCGPCKASFPFLQKVHEKYQSNPDIVILALNTWERVKGDAKEELVKKFIADNKYTFTVLYDENFVEQYGVTGIPTKFIIDKDGMIQFKSVGFMGGEKMIDEMDAQFDILLKGEHKK